jgi:hypothetical protein
MKLIIDFVPDYTSDEHPWFVESRSSRTSPKRDWYIWRDPAPDGGPPNNWTREQIDHNIFEKYSTSVTNFSAFDPESIMLYAIPDNLTVGNYEVGWNRVLSPTDKMFMGTIYPRSGSPAATEVEVSPPYVTADIGAHAEQDLYSFTITSAGIYTVETFGPTDVVMVLLGPNDQTTVIGEDDDGGSDNNAKISRLLQPGRYFVRVRHFRPTGTGTYEIAVRQAG